MSRWSLGLVAILTIAACSTPSLPPKLTVSQHDETADLTLRLELPWRANRRVQFVEGSNRVHITIDGPDLATPYEKLVELNTVDTTLVSLPRVPVGTHRIVSVQAVDSNNQAITGAVVATAGELVKGANTLALSATSTALADIARAILAMDRDKKTAILSKLVWTTANDAVAGYVRDLKVAHPGLLDTAAIATAAYTANGVFPAATASFVRQSGKLEIRPTNMAPGVPYEVSVSDPASRPITLFGNAPALIDNIAPGTWTLTMTPVFAGIPVKTQSVLIVPGASLKVAPDFATSTLKAPLADTLGPGASAVLPVSGQDTLVVVSGTTYNDADGLNTQAALGFIDANGALSAGPTLSSAFLQTAAAVHGGKLYWFGGRDDSAPLNTGFVYDPAQATPKPTAPMPSPFALRAATAGTIGDTIYVAGGIGADEITPNRAMLAYDPAGDTWLPSPLPTMPGTRWGMASAVVNGTWYLFGGLSVQNAFSGGSVGPFEMPQTGTLAFVASPSPAWTTKAAMPTARSGAAAVVVNNRVWVIGGAGLQGKASAAVEVYDPATNTWMLQPPLRRARAYPAAGLLNGKIVVVGGIDGADPLSALPTDAVEVITP